MRSMRHLAQFVVVVLFAALAVVGVGASPARAASCSDVSVVRQSGPTMYVDIGTSPAINSSYEQFAITNTSGATITDLWVTVGGFAGPRISLAANEPGRSHIGALANGATTNVYFYLSATAASGAESHTLSLFNGRPDLAGAAFCSQSVSLTAATDIQAAANKVTSVAVSPATPQLGGSFTVTVQGNSGTIGGSGEFVLSPASYASWPANVFKLTGSSLTLNGTTYTNRLYLSGLTNGGTYTATYQFAATGASSGSSPVSPMSHIASGANIKHVAVDSTYQALPPIPAPQNTLTTSASASPSTVATGGGTATLTLMVNNTGSNPVTLDDFVITLNGTSYVASSATFAGTATAPPSISSGTATFVGIFTVPANSSRTFTAQVATPSTPGVYTPSLVAHIGTTQIDTTASTTDNAPATATINVPSNALPTVTLLSPASGSPSGGTSVTVTGANFAGATAVTFGGTPAQSFVLNSASQIVAVAPAGSGTVDVRITTSAGTSSVATADAFTYSAVNNAPVFTATAANTTQSITAGTAPSALVATDADNDALTFAITAGALPTGILLQSNGTFAGSATTGGTYNLTVTVDDGRGGSASTALTITVTLPPGPVAPLLTTAAPSGQSQIATAAAPTGGSVRLLDGADSPVTSFTRPGEGAYSLDTSSGVITFIPVNGFTGTSVGVKYRLTDRFGQTGENRYQPTVNAGATPPAPPSISPSRTIGAPSNKQNTPIQVPSGGSATLLLNGNPVASISVPGVGTYRLDAANGRIEFEPVAGFRGTAPAVSFQVTDAYGQSASATYASVVQAPTKGGSTDVTPNDDGYWTVTASGEVVPKGNAPFFGSMADRALNAPVVGITTTANGSGYWQLGADGGVFAFGNAAFAGSLAEQRLNAPAVSIASTPDGNGYWIAGADGGVFTFGNATFQGSMANTPLNGRVVGLSPTFSGSGYWLAASDGGVFTFGDAPFLGSMANTALNAPIVGMAPTPSGQGYWLAAADGGVFCFGDAQFFGSTGRTGSTNRVVGIIATPDGGGYSLIEANGETVKFGNGHL